MPVPLPRLLLATLVLALLARAAWVAWGRRALAVAVWRSIRPRHVLGSLVLLVVVVTTSVAAAAAVPVLGRGLGDLVATSGNAVFAPLDVAAEATGPAPADGPDLLLLGFVTLFLALLACLLPWFAFVEEEVFRAGAETWALPTRVWAALVFGAAHLVMLVPFAAAVGISVAGFVYGELYRRGVARGRPTAPAPLVAAFRPTRRSVRSVRRLRTDPLDDRDHARRQVDGIYASTVWHTAFNTTVVVLVWSTFVVDQLA